MTAYKCKKRPGSGRFFIARFFGCFHTVCQHYRAVLSHLGPAQQRLVNGSASEQLTSNQC